ncbi:class II aldolase/adducin family protein [Oscillatoriales cyanobacterium LEGE 11467]|uniref:Class II aldolase/adducin family protein n=1 Tax=Zarconia navalis LEGE 11467 TaxID=1828826 RepID=A0A928Z7Q6_9CYAN|nr:class II aldolase/adducin family protein [Zarconia navalis]MBE9041677.1 class II aldolase/adducin family protein [Zarconia navalis LEGE 11467]
MMIDEGTIKYCCEWISGEPPPRDRLEDLMVVRDRLYALGLIGAYDCGIGFGNISVRLENSHRFIVSGTQTGHLPHLKPQHYTVVTDFSLGQNQLTCTGPVKASSESLTHASIYTQQPGVTGIIHVHNGPLWQQLLGRVPTTRREVPYGTPEMAREMWRLFEEEDLGERKMLVMAGHEDGAIAFGKDLAEAEAVLMEYYSAIDR